MKRNHLPKLIPFLLIFISLVAISCDNKIPEEKGSYSIKGKTFHIAFNKARDTSENPNPDSMTITINDDGSELLWTSIYSNYGQEKYQQGENAGNSTAVSATELAYEETVVASGTTGTSLNIRFNDDSNVTITGKIASNDISENAQSSIISSAKTDNVQAFKDRVYFGKNDSVGSAIYFSEDKVEYKLYTNIDTIYEAAKASGSINYSDIENFPHSPILTFLLDVSTSTSCKMTYNSDKDTFIDSESSPGNPFILTRIK